MGLITKVRGRVQNAPKTGNQCYFCGKSDFVKCTDVMSFGLFCHNRKNGSTCCYNFNKNPETCMFSVNMIQNFTFLSCPWKIYLFYEWFSVVLLLLLPLVLGRIGVLYACILYQYPVHTICEWGKSKLYFWKIINIFKLTNEEMKD